MSCRAQCEIYFGKLFLTHPRAGMRYRVLPEPYIFRDAHETVRFSYTEVVTCPAKCAIVFMVLISTKMFEEVSSLRESGSHP